MRCTQGEAGSVRWIDTQTGEDFTDRMNDPDAQPGEGILRLAGALGRLMAAQQIEAERQLLEALAAEVRSETNQSSPPHIPRADDRLMLKGMTYRYDGSTGDADHFTRLKGENSAEALVSLRRGCAAASWMLRQLNPATKP